MRKFLLLFLSVLLVMLCVSCKSNPKQFSAIDILLEQPNVVSVEQVRVTDYDNVDWSIYPSEYVDTVREMADGVVDKTISYYILYMVDNVEVQAYCSLPADYLENPRPLILYLRGGNGDYGAINQGEVAAYSYMSDCIVLATQYRNGFGVMMMDSEQISFDESQDQFGGDDVQDVLFWIERAKNLSFADTERIYLIGESRGGMELCLALRDAPNGIIKAAASVSGPYDLTQTYTEREDMREMLERRIGGTPATLPDAYASRSAVTFAEKINTPLLIIHSRGDEKVSYSQAEAFAVELENAGKAFDFWTRNDKSHGINSPEEMKSIVEWLEKQ